MILSDEQMAFENERREGGQTLTVSEYDARRRYHRANPEAIIRHVDLAARAIERSGGDQGRLHREIVNACAVAAAQERRLLKAAVEPAKEG